MSVLLRAELAKLTYNKWLFVLIPALSAVYVWMIATHYRWNESLAWEQIIRFPYSWGAVFQGLIVVFSLSPCFAQEHQAKTASLIFSTRNGRSLLTWAKIAASLLLITAIVIGFWAFNLTVNLGFAGMEGWDRPVQMLEDYSKSPYSLFMWQYVLVQVATNWIGCIAFALLTLFLSACIRSYLTIFFISGLLFVMPFLIRNSSELSWTWLMKNGSMIEPMRVTNLFNRSRYVEVGEWLLPLPLVAFYAYVVLLICLFLCGTVGRIKKKDVG